MNAQGDRSWMCDRFSQVRAETLHLALTGYHHLDEQLFNISVAEGLMGAFCAHLSTCVKTNLIALHFIPFCSSMTLLLRLNLQSCTLHIVSNNLGSTQVVKQKSYGIWMKWKNMLY